MRKISYYRRHCFAENHIIQQQGMTLLQVVFALAVFVIFGAVFLAVSEQLNLYFVPDNNNLGRLPDSKEEAPVPILLAERLFTAMDPLVSALEQQGAVLDDFPIGLSGCSKSEELKEPLTPIQERLEDLWDISVKSVDESKFDLASRYEFCLFYYGEKGSNNQKIYILVAKPVEKYKKAAMLPVVRRIFCRPKAVCVPTQQ